MPGIKTIYNKDGIPLTDIRTAAIRSWLLNDIGEAIFLVDTQSVKCKREYLEFGNWIVIQHNKLPDWVGMIDTPRIWHNRYVEVHAFEAPYLLKYRYSPLNETITGSPGEKFKTLLGYANGQGNTLIKPGVVSLNGASSDEIISDSVYTSIKNICTNNSKEWLCTPAIDTAGKLSINMDFVDKTGIQTDLELSQGFNVLYGDIPLEESGELLSSVEAVSDVTESGVITETYTENTTFGKRVARIQFPGITDSQALLSFAKSTVQKQKTPTINTPLTCVDVGSTFENIGLGNTIKYKYTNIGFDGDELGQTNSVRIYGFRFDEVYNTCEIFTGTNE